MLHAFFLPFKPLRFHSFRASSVNKIINTHRNRGCKGKREGGRGEQNEATRISHLQGGRPALSLLFLLLLLLRLTFLLFPTRTVAGGRLYTPLQRLDVHYIQLGYFSREFSHVNAARARTFAHTSTKFAVHVYSAHAYRFARS